MPRGRPSIYDEALVSEFCRRVASGRAVYAVCADDDMPADTTVYRWQEEKPAFRARLTLARDERIEAYAGRMIELARRVIEDADLNPQQVNAAVSAIDKAARLQQPKQRVEVTGKDGAPLQTETSAKDLAKAVALIMAKGLHATADD